MSKDAEKQNVWFGIAMFLGGVIVGVVLVGASGVSPFGDSADTPTAPTAPNAPQAPQANIQDRMIEFAKAAGVDESAFTGCIEKNAYKQMFVDQMSEGQKAGVNGTPGNILIDMKSGNARLLSGAQPLASFQKAVDEMLKNPTAKSTDPNTPAASNVTPVDLAKDHIRGSKTAQLALIEYSDYECPFCQRVHPTIQQLLDDNEGKVMWVYRHFPLSFHQNAVPLATGAECAAEIGGADAFWKYTDAAMSM